MPTNKKTLKAYQLHDQRRGAVMTAARKRKAAARHEEIAKQFRQDAMQLDLEVVRIDEQLETAR